MKNKLGKVLTTTLLVGALVGCQSGKSGSSEDKTITVGATPAPHAEILEVAKKVLKNEGYTLTVKEFTDYVQPNKAVDQGQLDANYFQHIPYLNEFNKQNGTKVVSVGKIHYEPFGIYAGKKSDLKQISSGDTIAIPNDTSNEARALLLLADNGLIELKDKTNINATIKDITKNKYNIKFKELPAEQLPRVTKEVQYAVINGNYALEAGYNVKTDSLAYEKDSSVAASTYANVVAVKKGNENTAKTKALVKALQSDEVKKFINDKYKGAVVPFEG